MWRGFLSGAAGSISATVCFNYFFLPPVGTFHIAERANWVALICFLIASVVASQLVVRARARAAPEDLQAVAAHAFKRAVRGCCTRRVFSRMGEG